MNTVEEANFELYEDAELKVKGNFADYEYENLKFSFKDYENEKNKKSDNGLSLSDLLNLENNIDCVVFDEKDKDKVKKALSDAKIKFNGDICCENAGIISQIHWTEEMQEEEVKPEAKLFSYRNATNNENNPIIHLSEDIEESFDTWNDFHNQLLKGNLDIE